MRELQSYTIDELEEATGVSRRNIRLYVSMGLLPSVGRRGPRTRYGQEYVDRLNFIQRVKQLQDAGQLPHSTLDYLGGTFKHILTAEEVAEGARSNARMIELFTQMRVDRARRRDARARGGVDDYSPVPMDRLEDPDMSEIDAVDEYSAEDSEQEWSRSSRASFGNNEEPTDYWYSPAAPTERSPDARESADLEGLQEELSMTRLRAKTEIQELTKLTDEISEQRSLLQRELKKLKTRIKSVRGKSDDE